MNRFKFRLNNKKDGDNAIIAWLESLPEGKRSSTVKEVLRGYIEDDSNKKSSSGKEDRGIRSGEYLDIEGLVDNMF